MYYFRKSKDSPRIRLPDDPKSDLFAEQYRNAFEGRNVLLPPSAREREAAEFRRRARGALVKALRGAKTRAADKGLEFDLSIQWAEEELERSAYLCPLTGIAFDRTISARGRRSPYGPSIDRVDNSRGYVTDNCRVVITAINIMMSDWGEDVFETVAKGFSRRLRNERRTATSLTQIQNPSPGKNSL